MIHEFDPYFNFRTTQVLVTDGFYAFHNWFDNLVWYPLGRIVGTTVFPGLMATAGLAHWLFNSLNITVNIRNVCVVLSPAFAAFTAWITFLFAKECGKSSKRSGEAVGLTAAALMSVVPGYVSRSVAGSFDNEAVAIFALVNTFYMFVKAVNTGSLMWAGLASVAYYYMVTTWGGYVFLINLIPLYTAVMVLVGRFSHRLYVAYCTFYAIGTLFSMQVAFVGFQPVSTSEHMLAFLVFGFMQVVVAFRFLGTYLSEEDFRKVIRLGLAAVVAGTVGLATLLWATGYVAPWAGRFYSLLDPLHLTYVSTQLLKSVSEHQPPTWSTFFFDFHLLVITLPAGVYMCFQDVTDGSIFAILYSLTSLWFSGSMVRLMLVLAPIMAVVGGIAVSTMLQAHAGVLKEVANTQGIAHVAKKPFSIAVLAVSVIFLSTYCVHCTWVTSEAYSSPSIVLSARSGSGRIIFDDYREAYYWLRMNTPEDAKVMSWWDYGYQLAAMANRTTLVDNNTWNNTHIATVGAAMASPERAAYRIMRRLDVDYVLVIFGGLIGFSSDDINKFLWMVRISGSVDDRIKESDYLSSRGQYRIDNEASETLKRSLMYKMCYYRFGEMKTDYSRPAGWDRVRNAEVGDKNIKLKYISEAYTTEHWMVRIYKVNPLQNRKLVF
jgi:dolichyl-diphosphooligosaccharide--protein glycosyltransferase